MNTLIKTIIILGIISIIIIIIANSNKKKADEKYEKTSDCERCNKPFKDSTDKHLHTNKRIYCTDCLAIVKGNQAKQLQTLRESQMQKQEKQKSPEKIICPKCNGDQLTADGKKLSIGRAIVGNAVAGPVGAILGGSSSKKVKITCLNCGHSWTAGKRK